MVAIRITALAVASLVAGNASGDIATETSPITQPVKPNACASDGAIEGESLPARIERLRTALRLALAEQAVNRPKGRKK